MRKILKTALILGVLSTVAVGVSGCDKKSREEDKKAAQSFADSTKDLHDNYIPTSSFDSPLTQKQIDDYTKKLESQGYSWAEVQNKVMKYEQDAEKKQDRLEQNKKGYTEESGA
jgi:Na+-translocating ferredoxin:NAD+ oxidoreductase RnfG subunit